MTNEPTPPPPTRDTGDELHDRMQAFGREAQAAGERLGRQAQAAGERLAADPNVVSAGIWFGRLWGLVLIAVGLWFFGQVTLGLDLPSLDWNLAWPIVLILVGGTILVSGLARRR